MNNQFNPPYTNTWSYAGKHMPEDRVIYYDDGLEFVKNDDGYNSGLQNGLEFVKNDSGSQNGFDFKNNQNTQFSDDSGSHTQKADNILVGYKLIKKVLYMLQDYTSLSFNWIMNKVNKQMEQVELNQAAKTN